MGRNPHEPVAPGPGDPARTRMPRPRLADLVERVSATRLTTVVAPAGYGKTTLLAAWAAGPVAVPVAWHTVTTEDLELYPLASALVGALRHAVPEFAAELPRTAGDLGGSSQARHDSRAPALAGLLCDAVAAVPGGLLLVLDDVHLIGQGTASARLLEALCQQAPPAMHLVLAGRRQPPFPVQRLRNDGELVEVSASQLAFTAAETGRLLADRLGAEPSSQVADTVHSTTGGWPIAVRLAVEALSQGAPADAARALKMLQQPGPVFDHLAHEIFDHEPRQVRGLVRSAALFQRVTADLLVALGHPDAAAVLADLVERGLFVEPLRGRPGWFGLMPLVRTVAGRLFPLARWERTQTNEVGAAWFTANGQLEDAVASLAAMGAYRRIEHLLAEHAKELLHGGEAETVITAVRCIPPDERGLLTWRLAGEAHQLRGDWNQALECLERAAGTDGPVSAAVARRIGWMHYLRGAPAEALQACQRGQPDGTEPKEESLLYSCEAGAQWAHGEREACRAAVTTAIELGLSCRDDAALATAYTVRAMLAAADGDHSANASYYTEALLHARRAGDVLSEIRIRVNRASHYVEAGNYHDALAELAIALPQAEITGFLTYRGLGLNNRGEAWLGLGDLDHAAADLQAAKTLYTGTGSRLLAAVLTKLGEVYRLRGDRALARAAYEEAVRLAERANTVTQLVPALAGLTDLLAGEEPELAGELVERALSHGTGIGYAAALLAAGRLALTRGARAEALRRAGAAEEVARTRWSQALLAESLELQAAAIEDPERALTLLDQAAAIYAQIGNALGAVRILVAKARLAGGVVGRELAERAEREARRLGARGLAAEAFAVAEGCYQVPPPAVFVQTLGGFRVLCGGEPVPVVQWQSTMARDLLKILIARRGRPVARDTLMAQLWPAAPGDQAADRLQDAVEVAGAALGAGTRRCVVADGDVVRLDLATVTVDVEDFLVRAASGLAAVRQGRGDALPLLSAAEAEYTGDFLEEDPYADWAMGLREEARLTYLQVAAALAEQAEQGGEHTTASRYCLRILERDRYEETAHLALVRALTGAGKHGEARRWYQVYAVRMGEIGVEPRPFPAVVGSAAGG